MDGREVANSVREWLGQERLEVRGEDDERAHCHLVIRYPHGKQGHLFGIIVPKGRDIVIVQSMTRVDSGQQMEMSKHMKDDPDGWKEWIHEARLSLINTGVDWAIHMGHDGKSKPGPLQAFNVSKPIWFDGLTKDQLMQTLRQLWMAKLTLIHEIKFTHGLGTGEPGPVDDWNAQEKQIRSQKEQPTKRHQIEFDEDGSFGNGFNPSDWV